MIIELLIEKLQGLQKDHPGINVSILDWRKNLGDDDGDGSSAGIYSYFEIHIEKLEGEECEFFEEHHGRPHIPWVAISFESEDYSENGDCLI